MSAYWEATAKAILAEYKAHPDNWREQPTIKEHLCPHIVGPQHMLYAKLIDAFCPPPSNIIEIGGGFGSLMRHLRAKYECPYTIIDLPEMLEFQQAVQCGDDVSYYSHLREAHGLLVATFSVSEMDPAERDELEPAYRYFDSLFFAFNNSFGGVENVPYFERLAVKLSDTHHIVKMSHNRWGAHHYLIATRK